MEPLHAGLPAARGGPVAGDARRSGFLALPGCLPRPAMPGILLVPTNPLALGRLLCCGHAAVGRDRGRRGFGQGALRRAASVTAGCAPQAACTPHRPLACFRCPPGCPAPCLQAFLPDGTLNNAGLSKRLDTFTIGVSVLEVGEGSAPAKGSGWGCKGDHCVAATTFDRSRPRLTQF
jgi:hypothetical protein